MNNVDCATIYHIVMYSLPGIGWLIATMILIYIAGVVGQRQMNSVWKNNIKYHMTKVVREELEKRDKKISLLTIRLNTWKKENARLKRYCAAMTSLAKSMDGEKPNG